MKGKFNAIIFLYSILGLILSSGTVVARITPEQCTAGLVLKNGSFYPTHSFSHLEGGPSLGTNEIIETIGYPDDSHLPDPTPLVSNYQAASLSDNAYEYFSGLTSLEKATLYRALGEEEKAFLMQKMRDNFWDGKIGPFLRALPSGEAGPALNKINNVYWMDISNLNLEGWDTTGKSLYGSNFVGSNITAEQLNASGSSMGNHYYLNLSGQQNLENFDTSGKYLLGTNFVGSNISIAQLNAAADIGQINISGFQNLETLQTAGKNLIAVNFADSNISIAQLEAANDIRYTNLSRVANIHTMNTTNRTLENINFSGTSITLAQLMNSSCIYGVNLSNTSITREELQQAIQTAGKTGWQWEINSIAF